MSFDTEKFIICVQQNECIWNKQDKSHHDTQKIHVGWTNVAKSMIDNFDNLEEHTKREKVKDLKTKWKNVKDTYRKKSIKKSGQAAKTEKKYIYADILEFLRPTMENRKTDSNVAGSDDTENGSDEDIDVQNTSNIDQVTASSSQQPKQKRKKTQNFEETLIAALGSRQAREDPVSSFLMSLAPQIRGLEQVQQNQVFIEFLTVLQNIKYSNLPKQSNNPNLYHQSQTNISNSSLPPQNYSNVNYSYPVYPYNNFSSTPSSSGLPLIPNPHLSPTISSSPLPPHLSASEYPSNSPNNTQYQNRPL